MGITLTLSEAMIESIQSALALEVESAGVLVVGLTKSHGSRRRIVAQELVWVPNGAYAVRAADEMIIRSEGYIDALSVAASRGAACMWFHTHPGKGGVPLPSRKDEAVDRALEDVFMIRTDTSFYGSAIFSRNEAGISFSAKCTVDHAWHSVESLVYVGDRVTLIPAYDAQDGVEASTLYDRQVRAFGGPIQKALSALNVAVVGCGGTGSAVAEQLVRLGVRNLTLVDPDILTESNITRVYGSSMASVGKAKVEVLGAHLSAMFPGVNCRRIKGMVTMPEVAEALSCEDVVFGCTDDNAGRVVLSRMPTYLSLLLIDCGVLLSSDKAGRLVGIDGRVTVVAPGLACLVCRQRIDMRRAATELLTPAERKRLEDEGYAPALGDVEPSVVNYTTAVATAAVGELLERMVGYGPSPRPSEVLLRLHEREVSTNSSRPMKGHYCDPDAGKFGRGATASPFLEQVWPS